VKFYHTFNKEKGQYQTGEATIQALFLDFSFNPYSCSGIVDNQTMGFKNKFLILFIKIAPWLKIYNPYVKFQDTVWDSYAVVL
jgi:hypothetical protein